jgi:Xaa-Pro aminopeptidase
VHQIEKKSFGKIFGYVETYASREELVNKLSQILPGRNTILMEYSPKGNNPYVSYVDAGTFELIKSLGAKIESSQDLVQYLLSRWDKPEYQSHQEAARILLKIKDLAFEHVADKFRQNQNLTEYDLQQFILREFEKNRLVTDSGPDCAVNRNSANPHYTPTRESSLPIQKGDFLLIDLWGKKDLPEAMYADITWVAYVGEKVPDKYGMIFKIVAQARDAAIDYLKRNWPKSDVHGWQVDDAARQVIRKAGYADFFVHRTGHSLGKTIHSWGVNLDNFETRDERRIIPGVGFTIEPGIYLKDFGIRSEINLYAGEQGIEITTLPLQQEIIPLLKPR